MSGCIAIRSTIATAGLRTVKNSLAGAAFTALTVTGCVPDGGAFDPPGGPGVVECAADLAPGALVISEIMGNPDGADDGNEWFEIVNPGPDTIDLAGLVLEYRGVPDDPTSARTHAVAEASVVGGGYFVFGDAAPDSLPSFVDYGYGDDLGSLANTGERRLALRCNHADTEVEIDAVTYAGLPEGTAMALTNLEPPDSVGNDDWERAWCTAGNEFAPGNLGTPGAGNDCGAVAPGMCLEHDAGDGGQVARPVLSPTVGDLVITEVMPNPAAVGDSAGEWFELAVTRDVDLNGVTVGRDPSAGADHSIADNECRRVTAGSHLVFARTGDSDANGGLPAVDEIYGFALVNSGGRLFVGDADGAVLDTITWASSPSGASLSLDPQASDPLGNDAEASFCASAESPYGAGDHGTPGADNLPCPPVVTPGTCIDPDSGELRGIVVPEAGQLVITEFMANPDGVGDSVGEWIEVRAAADIPFAGFPFAGFAGFPFAGFAGFPFAGFIDLNGLEVGKRSDSGSTGATVISAPECLPVSAGEYAVFARTAEPARNGCIANPAGVFGFGLNNSGNTVYIRTADGELDAVHYANTTPGVSSSRDEVTGAWCSVAGEVYDTCLSGANSGTPGAANTGCPP